nr:CNNM domain-containing protein [Spirochaetota bacterium]
MIELYLLPLIVVIAILIQAFFSNSEMAMVSSNKIKLNYMANNGDKKAGIILNLLNKPDKLFGTTLVGINLATVISTAVADYYFHEVFIKYYPAIKNFISLELLTFIVMEPAILIFGELFPMSLARKYPNTVALRNSYLIKTGYFVFFPLMFIVSNISSLIGKIFKSQDSGFGKISRDELELLVSGRFSQITENTRKIIKDVFDINELTAKDVMTHLNEVKSVESDSTVEDLKELMKATDYSRFPVFSESIFNIVATIHAVNILGVDDKENIMPYTEKLYIVPSSKPVVQILTELKRNRKYMGIVVDEYGA